MLDAVQWDLMKRLEKEVVEFESHFLITPNEITEVLREMIAAQQSVQRTALPCGHDANNLRMGVNGYGCAECESSRR